MVGDVNTSVKGIFQQQAKKVVALCASRPDLTVRKNWGHLKNNKKETLYTRGT